MILSCPFRLLLWFLGLADAASILDLSMGTPCANDAIAACLSVATVLAYRAVVCTLSMRTSVASKAVFADLAMFADHSDEFRAARLRVHGSTTAGVY